MCENNLNKTKWIEEYNKNNNNEYGNYTFSGQYLVILLPTHHLARIDGYVYIHQLQAEKKLGRKLKNGECVHHINENKYDNDECNLIVFKTISDHVSFHRGSDIYQDGDVWVSDKNGISKKEICPICNKNNKEKNASMCKSCYLEHISANIPSKEYLMQLLLSTPMVKIGEIFHVSDNAVRKWCKKYDLPYKYKDILKFRNEYSNL